MSGRTMMTRAGVLVIAGLVAISGCVAPDSDTSDGGGHNSFEIEETGMVIDAPAPAGGVVYIQNDLESGVRTMGFNLTVPEEYLGGGGDVYKNASLGITPFGSVSFWAVLAFNDLNLRGLSMSIDYEVEREGEPDPFAPVPRAVHQHHVTIPFTDGGNVSLIVAMEGPGGLALYPVHEEDLDETPVSLTDLSQRPGGTAEIIGAGVGFDFVSVQEVSWSGGREVWTLGSGVEVSWGDSGAAGEQLRSIQFSKATNLSGWGQAVGWYRGIESHGEYFVELNTPSGPERASETIRTTPVIGTITAGIPGWFAQGDNALPWTVTYGIDITTTGASEGFGFQLLALGESRSHLLGYEDSWVWFS